MNALVVYAVKVRNILADLCKQILYIFLKNKYSIRFMQTNGRLDLPKYWTKFM